MGWNESVMESHEGYYRGLVNDEKWWMAECEIMITTKEVIYRVQATNEEIIKTFPIDKFEKISDVEMNSEKNLSIFEWFKIRYKNGISLRIERLLFNPKWVPNIIYGTDSEWSMLYSEENIKNWNLDDFLKSLKEKGNNYLELPKTYNIK